MQNILTRVGLGTIFTDIIGDNPTIKGRVGKRAFRYIVSKLGCVQRFTNSNNTMCGCTQCIGLQTQNCLLQAKRGGMHKQIAIDLQHRTRKTRANEMAKGWGNVGLHPTPLDALKVGTCARWTAHAIPHWECQTLQRGTCRDYPVPAKEARSEYPHLMYMSTRC